MGNIFKKMAPVRMIALGFAAAILLGSVLLMLPFSVKGGTDVKYIDILYTSTSAVCVTGLIAVDAGDTFTPFGQAVLCVLIQIGGLGVTAISTGIIMAMGKKINIRGRSLIREAMNLSTANGIVKFVKRLFLTTLCFEAAGALLSFPVFLKDFGALHAAGISIFHSIAAFNNSGFDILGGGRSLTPYYDNIFLNIVTAVLIFFGGIGFLVIQEMLSKKFCFKKFSMHAKSVLFVSFFLTAAGTVLFRLTENITWLGAFFQSVSARTAGFCTYNIGSFSNAGILLMIVLMFIGASPGSTGGGIKTSTFFVLLLGIRASASNTGEKAFKYSVPSDAFRKAAVITLIGIGIVTSAAYILIVLEGGIELKDALFEMTSAFGTVGLTTGITQQLGTGGKLLSILIMYIGRLGPFTIASLWNFKNGDRVSYPEGNIAVG